MSVGPVSGDGIPVALPPGKTVFWNVTAQAAYSQFVQLNDPGGVMVFSASGSSPGGHSPTQIGQGSFVAQGGNYMLYVGTDGGSSWSSVLWDVLTLSLGGAVICSNFNFISEDGADQDFNDSAVALTWFNSIG